MGLVENETIVARATVEFSVITTMIYCAMGKQKFSVATLIYLITMRISIHRTVIVRAIP